MSDKPLPTPPYSLVDENQTQGGPSRRPSYTSTQTDSYLRKADEEAELAYDDLLSNAHFEKSTGKLKLDIDGKDVHDLAESAGLKEAEGVYGDSDEDFTSSIAAQQPRVPRLNILILIVGSRGDVQPYIALGMRLAEDGHRVRLGTHKEFRDFVREASSRKVEFFDIGGDPRELMAYMVKNPGLIPGWKSLKSGDVGKNTKMLKEILAGTFRACVFPDLETQIPFSANAIIANPPCFGHIHVAEALGIPLHMSFTMPWSPTTAFPHPLVDLQFKTKGKGKDKDVSEEPSPQTSNYVSYALADHLTWLGLQRVINKFRCKTLGLPALSSHSGTGVIHRLKIPYTYCWSPALIPKPKDWKSNIDISGFYFLDLSTEYTPPPDLAKFLASGPAPIYIGFGSVPVKDPVKMSQILLEAVRKAGVRVLISAGWAGLGGAESSDDVFLLGNVPHDWLFKHVSAVCHHGGAGTTAIGLANGRPSIIVPFFGDQVFWGNMVHRAGAGPEPIPADRLNVENLTMAIQQALSKETLTAAGRMGEIIRSEDGVQRGVDSFYHKLPLDRMHCEVRPDLVAEWYYESLDIRLSAFAAATLIKSGRLKSSSLEPLRSAEYRTSRV
uniref:Uncharacterized protein n=1 Tax=Kwoniella dejecticola CBS 10117 TaxID=1296121 RepID=A0A1A6A7M4_9TREE|nr:uncharacterized protein I303_03774 [Kwoniella dejecticola CBS 10117]OBR86056.1 hypothetical protein I303_03774 [Kwoniella dejecticola CBS 10117]